MTRETVPEIVFHTRVRNDALGGANPFEWRDLSSPTAMASSPA